MSTVTLIEESAQKSRRWLDGLAEELGRPGDQKYALRVLRGFLHTLRDRLPVPETAHLSAQLPEFIRGLYYEGWRPATVPPRQGAERSAPPDPRSSRRSELRRRR